MGYGAFPSGMIEYLWRAKQPYNVSVASETAARAALTNPTYLDVVGACLFVLADVSHCVSSHRSLSAVNFL